MGSIQYRKRVKLSDGTWVNVSKSGVSVSARKKPVTVNSRGVVTFRLAKGLRFRSKLF